MRGLTLFLIALASLGFAVGCGSGGSQTSSNQSAPSSGLQTGQALTAAGPSDPATNLEHLLSKSTPELVDVSVSCPSSARPDHYPFRCGLEAKKREGEKPVRGRVTVIGIYRPTRTYAFEVTYGPGGSATG